MTLVYSVGYIIEVIKYVVSRSQTAIFSFILGREKIGSGTPPIEKAVLASTAIGVGDYWQWLLCKR